MAPIPSGTYQLIGDATAVFGLTTDGTIWALDAGSTSARPLIVDPSGGAISFTLAGRNLFWSDARGGTLHRTARDGSGDVTLASGLVLPGLVTTDDINVYWRESMPDSGFGDGGGTIRSLPLDAVPGDTPTELAVIAEDEAVASMVATGGSLYWTPYPLDSTVYYSSLLTAPVATLLAGGAATAIPGITQPFDLTVSGANIYFAYFRDLWTTVIAELADQDGGASDLLSILPINAGLAGLLVTDDWLLASASAEDANRPLYLYATPLDSPAGFVVVAAHLLSPAVISPWGVTYVNDAGALVAFPASQLGYVGFGSPPP